MKYVGSAEFKANCLRLMAEVQAGGEAITVTRPGKPVVVVSAPAEVAAAKPLASAFGLLKSDRYRDGIEPEDFRVDPDREAKWDERGFPAPAVRPLAAWRSRRSRSGKRRWWSIRASLP